MRQLFISTAVLFCLFQLNNNAFAQPTSMSVNQSVGGIYANTVMVLKGNDFQARFQEIPAGTTSGIRDWQFNADTYFNTWGVKSTNGANSVNLAGYNSTILPNAGTASANFEGGPGYNNKGKLPATQGNYYYTYNIIRGTSYADQKMAVLETSFNPVTISAVSDAAGINGSRNITITTSATPNAGENIFVRYSTNNFASSTLIQATPSGTLSSANIPYQGSTVNYYVYSSNRSAAAINADVASYGQDVHDISMLNLNNNSGVNYSYAAPTGDITGPTIIFSSLTGTCSGSPATLMASITDPSGVPTTGPGLPVIYWKINSGSNNASPGTYIGGSQYQFSLGAGAVPGNVVSYYVVAQDANVPANVSAYPSAGATGFSASPPAVSTPPTSPNTYIVSPAPATPTITPSGPISFCAGGSVTLTTSFAGKNNLHFPGSTTVYVDAASTPAIELTTALSIEAWIKLDFNPPYSGPQYIVSKGTHDNLNGQYGLLVLANGVVQFHMLLGTSQFSASGTTILQGGQWYHVAGTWDGTTMKLYVNGNQEGSNPLSGSLVPNSSEHLRIGQLGFSPGFIYPFQGAIDELRIWNVARTAPQILATKNLLVDPASANLAAYYRFDEGSGSTTADLTVNANTASLVNGPGWQVSTAPINYSSYLWSPGALTSSAISANSTGSYSVTVQSPEGCTVSSTPISVTVTSPPPTPTITAGGPTTFCTGGSVTLTSSAVSGNQWSLNGNPISGATNQTLVANIAGNYTVIVTTSGCPSASSLQTLVTINPTPSTPAITPGGPTTFCSGGMVTLTSSVGTGNQWYSNGNPIFGATNFQYNAISSGNYTVVVTTNGCSSPPSNTITVTVNQPPPPPTITPSGPTTFCTGGSVTLMANFGGGAPQPRNDGPAAGLPNSTIIVSGYQWYLNGGLIGGATNQSYNANSSGDYTVVLTTNGCASSPSAITTVTVNTIPPTPSITPGGPTTFCNGGSVTLSSSSASGNQWNLNGNPISGAVNQNYIVTVSGDYTVIVTNSGCSSSPSTITTVTVNPTPPTPTITPGGPITFCTGGSVTLMSSASSGNQWSMNGNPIGGATNQTYVANSTGNYTVIVTSLSCSSAPSGTITVTVNPIPTTTTITPGGPTTFCNGGSVTLSSSSASGNQWYLNNNPIGSATGTTYNATTAGSYTVIVTLSGCSSAASSPVTVTINPLPTVNCPSNINQPSDQGQCGAIVNFTATASGTPTPTITYSKNPGTLFPVGTTTVLVTATNTCGTATCTFTVTVAGPKVSIPTVYAVAPPGGAANTIYKTYGPQSLNLTANVTGAVNPTYSWTGTAITGPANNQTVNVAPTAAGDYTYSVVVTASGCVASGSTIVHVVNVNCGGNKVYLCLTSSNTTICMGPGWVPGYLANGYTLGACSIPTTTIVGDTSASLLTPDMGGNSISSFNVMISPNPSAGVFKLKVTSPTMDPIQVRLIDNLGRTLQREDKIGLGSIFEFGNNLRSGTYFVEVAQGVNKKVVKVVKLN